MAELRGRPWLPVKVIENSAEQIGFDEIRKADCAALQAVAQGVANEGQQKRAIAAIMHICGTDDLEFLPAEHGGERDSAFKGGKRFVGLQLRKLTSVPLSILTGENNDGRTHDRRTGKPADGRNASRAKQ